MKIFGNVYKITTYRAIKHNRTSGTAGKQAAFLNPFPTAPLTEITKNPDRNRRDKFSSISKTPQT